MTGPGDKRRVRGRRRGLHRRRGGDSLRYEGFEVDEASTGRAALTAAQERAPDLIVLDVMLPDLDGLEVTAGCGGTASRCRSCSLPRATQLRTRWSA